MKRDDSNAGCEQMDQRLSSRRKTMTQIPTVKPTFGGNHPEPPNYEGKDNPSGESVFDQ